LWLDEIPAGQVRPIVYTRSDWSVSGARRSSDLLHWAIFNLVLAIIAGVSGFDAMVSEATWIAKILLVAFVILFGVSLIAGRKAPSSGI
jgi:uncharacterized membrane protein YtjA (UPF0391 family)